MKTRLLAVLAALSFAPACAVDSNWYLMDSGYSIHPVPGDELGYKIEVHRNQLKQLGGDLNSAQFNRFIAERLKEHGMCLSGWQPLRCIEDGSCVQQTARSVTVAGRCFVP
jgi:hypothetical protein